MTAAIPPRPPPDPSSAPPPQTRLGTEHAVVYLTGAPAAGKGTLARSLAHALAARAQRLAVFEYGQRLTAYLAARSGQALEQAGLRARSSNVVSTEDIEALDRVLLAFVAEQRAHRHVLIDTHAVTKDPYGFRIRAYSLANIAQLGPTIIIVLYTGPEVAVVRIDADPGGRPTVTAWEAGFHTNLQASVAVAYATELGVPVYLLDGDRSADVLAEDLADRRARGVAAPGAWPPSRSSPAPPAGAVPASISARS